MKLSIAALLMAAATPAAMAAKTISAGKHAAKVLRSARKLADGDDATDAQYDYLLKYNLKLIGCKQGEKVTDADGTVEYSAVMFRLCPTASGCTSDSVSGCKTGYGDFVVGLDTFVEAYFEDQRDNMHWDDALQVDQYTTCNAYQQENGDDAVHYYIGPACTSDSLDVRLALFDDDICTQETTTTFASISNGWTLPYSSGGLVSTSCSDCTQDDGNGNYELRDMCKTLYTSAAYGCEKSMQYFSYYGQNVKGCTYIKQITPKAVKSATATHKGGKVFGWIVFVVLVVGFAGYIMWWRKKKQAAAHGSSSDGLVA